MGPGLASRLVEGVAWVEARGLGDVEVEAEAERKSRPEKGLGLAATSARL